MEERRRCTRWVVDSCSQVSCLARTLHQSSRRCWWHQMARRLVLTSGNRASPMLLPASRESEDAQDNLSQDACYRLPRSVPSQQDNARQAHCTCHTTCGRCACTIQCRGGRDEEECDL